MFIGWSLFNQLLCSCHTIYLYLFCVCCCYVGGHCERMQVACNSQQDLHEWLDLLTKHTHTPASHTHSYKPQAVCHTVRVQLCLKIGYIDVHRLMLMMNWILICHSVLFFTAALSPRHSLQVVRVSCREYCTYLPHPSPSLFLWDRTQQQSIVGTTGATKHPQTLEPELPSPCTPTPTLSCSLPERGTHEKQYALYVTCISHGGSCPVGTWV